METGIAAIGSIASLHPHHLNTMTDQEIIYTIALTRLPQVGLIIARKLYESAGSATTLYQHRHSLRDILPDATPRLIEAVSHFDEYIAGAEREMDFIGRKGIKAYTLADPAYPRRLLDCHDSPTLIFHCGTGLMNQQHTLSIVGSRRCTPYGRDMCRAIVRDLSQMVPDLLIVSGLAYGIDISAHRAAIEAGLPTIAVLAHGLDRIYPATHRNTAVQMVNNGGLITEYPSGTTPDRMNFVQRNRIVAGMADATLVVESGEHSGSLITADMALSYNRDVFAMPGRVCDEMSQGCNILIRKQKAQLIQTAEDIVTAMNWNTQQNKQMPKQQTLFPELTTDEQRILNLMSSDESIQINQIVTLTGMNYSAISYILYELECKGIVELLGGARYRKLT